MEPILIISTVLALLIGSGLGYACFRYMLTGKYRRTIKAAEKQSEVLKEKKLLEVREKFLNKKNELERDTQQRNQKLQQVESKLKQREQTLTQRQEEINKRKGELEEEIQRLQNQQKALANREADLEKIQRQEQQKLEELSGLSAEDAKMRLVESL